MAKDIKELMAKVGRIRILTNRLIDENLSGDYHSSFKGQGVEFEEVRPYVAGDDVRSIDWNVTARTGIPYIKRYSEERELTVLFVVDVSGSLSFGSRTQSKMELAAEITSLLALTAIKNQDKIGLVLFSDKIVKYIPPRKGRDSVMRLVREVLAAEDEAQGGTDISMALKFLNSVQKRKAVVFLVSDFLSPIEKYNDLLRATSHHHDVICVDISDPAEYELPDVGLIELEDPESGELCLIDTSSAKVRKNFSQQSKKQREEKSLFFRKNAIDTLNAATDRAYINDVRLLFKKRGRK